MALVLDTSVLYAALDESDPRHADCDALIVDATETLVIPAPVLVEVDYWIRKFASPDVWMAFCEDVAAGNYQPFALDAGLLLAAAKLQVRYADLPLGFVDASVFVACSALGEKRVATLDRRHFSILRTEDGGALNLLPA